MNKQDPNDDFWGGAEYGWLDASFCFLVHPKTRDLLIYTYGDADPKARTLIPGHHIDKIWATLLNAKT